MTENETNSNTMTEGDVLVVVSKLKNYIRAKSGFNTSGSVATVISELVRKQLDNAIEKAKTEGRKTVMDRDFELQNAA